MSMEELLENRRKQNAKNRIPDLKDEAFDINRVEVMGCPVLKLIHKNRLHSANLFLIGVVLFAVGFSLMMALDVALG